MGIRDLPMEKRQRVREKVSDMLGVEVDQVPIDFDDDFYEHIGADSLDMIEIVMEVEDEFDARDDDDSPMPPFALA